MDRSVLEKIVSNLTALPTTSHRADLIYENEKLLKAHGLTYASLIFRDSPEVLQPADTQLSSLEFLAPEEREDFLIRKAIGIINRNREYRQRTNPGFWDKLEDIMAVYQDGDLLRPGQRDLLFKAAVADKHVFKKELEAAGYTLTYKSQNAPSAAP